jgi:uncharacterized membrane protein YgcG
MVFKQVAILVGLLLASLSGFGQPSATYPKSKGVVSDYAGKLNRDEIGELTDTLQQYQRKTSIEFVVVVVDSLHGQSAREYAIGLGDAWAVGKSGRDNGIVLLWAPNERAYSLRIAEGLKADISDSDAARITQLSLLPNFKSGHYYGGLKYTVAATIAQLGDQTWDERLQARARAAEQARQTEEERRQEADQQARAGRQFLVGAFLVMAILGLGILAMYRWRERRKKLAELAQAGAVVADNLAKAEANAPQIQRLLDDFAKEAPEQDISALRAKPAGQPDRIAKLKLDATLLDFTDLKSYAEMIRIKSAAEAEADLLEETQGTIGDIKTAKAQSQTLMDQLSKENFAISDIRDSSRRSEIDQMLLRSREDYELARRNSSMSVVDWLLINEMLSRSHSQVQRAVVYSQEEPYAPAIDSSDSSNSSSSDSSSGGFFGSSDSGSSFGGGGGFSGGSGSDGSY